MRLLLDTHVWLWLLSDPGRLQPDLLRLLRNTKSELLLSAASSWEISVKYRLGKLALPEPPDTFVPSRLRTTGTTPIPIEHAHALATTGLPLHHRDPFDRLLIAQSMVLKVPLVTADPQFEPYEIETIFT
jgi:PIN domain nuclease of toxin-antitoxin system